MTHAHKEWTPKIAARTEEILRRAEKLKPAWIRSIDFSLYWVLLFIAIVGNFIISVILVPFLLILEGFSLYFSLFFIGASFGWIFSFILHSLAHKHQHIVALIFIPALALINVGIFAILSNNLIGILNLTTPPHNPFLIGAVYVLGYVLPDSISHLKRK